MRTNSYVVMVFSLLIATSISLSCGDDNPVLSNESGHTNLLQNVVFEPDSGPPGTPIEMKNLPALPGDGFWSLSIGEASVPIIQTDSSNYTIIPLLFSSTDSTWPMASGAPLDVMLYLDSVAVDTAFGLITVDSLPHADGATDSLIQALVQGADAIRQISLSLNIQDTLLQAVCGSMTEMLVTGDNSLTAIINGTSPIVDGDPLPNELFSALLVSTGMSDMISTWSGGLQTMEQAVAKYNASSLSTATIDDEGLAYRMQMYSLLEGFSSQVIGQTALEWNSYSAVLGCAGVAYPPLGAIEFIVSFVVAELDFIFNKIALALLPSQVTSLELDFMEHEIESGDTTEAIVYISAKNTPPNITPLDIVTQVINAMNLADWISHLGAVRRYLPQNVYEIAEGLTRWFLGVINNFLGTHFNAPTMLDASLPVITYDSILVQNPSLVDLISPALSKIEPITGSINGLAKDSTGKAPLMIATQTSGPNTLIHSVLAAAGYAGGAFGYDYYTSNVDTVTVVPDLALEADFANTIPEGGANLLGIHAGYFNTNGTSRWTGGIQINLTVSGGTVSTTTGYTDASGYFSTMVTIDSTAEAVSVHVFAYGEYNSQSDTIVIATKEGNDSSIDGVGFGGAFKAIAQADTVYRKTEWHLQEYYHSSDSYDNQMRESYALSSSFEGGSAIGNLGYDCHLTIDSAGNEITMTETFTMSQGIGYSVGDEGYHNAGVVTSYFIIDGSFFFGVTGNALVTVEYSSAPESDFGLSDILWGPDYTEFIVNDGTWQGVLTEGNHMIRFRQIHSMSQSIPPRNASYSDQASPSGSLTIRLQPL